MKSEKFCVSREERNQILVLDTPLPYLMFSGAVAALLIFLLLLYVGLNFFSNKFFGIIDRQDIDILFYVVFFFLGAAVGVISAQLRRFEFASMVVSYKKSEFYKVSFYLLYIFYFSLFAYPAFIYYLPLWKAATGKDVVVLVPALIIVIAVLTWSFKNFWDFLFVRILRIAAPVDSEFLLERNFFERVMKFKFSEAARYKIPFSLMLVGVANLEQLRKQLSRRKYNAMQKRVLGLLLDTMRDLDFVSRIDNGQMVAVLIHTTGVAARKPADRFLERSEDFFVAVKQTKVRPDFRIGIADFNSKMKNEEELIKRAGLALEQAMHSKEYVVQL